MVLDGHMLWIHETYGLQIPSNIASFDVRVQDRCIIDVALFGTSRTWSSWFEIWTAGIEIQTLCISNGLEGLITHIGKISPLSLVAGKGTNNAEPLAAGE